MIVIHMLFAAFFRENDPISVLNNCIRNNVYLDKCNLTDKKFFSQNNQNVNEIVLRKVKYVENSFNSVVKASEHMPKPTINFNPYSEPRCQFVNTIEENGICKCKSEFPYGDPYGGGCWQCKPKCLHNSICKGPNYCICPLFHVGDGVNYCSVHIPAIVGLYGRISDSTAIIYIDPIEFPLYSQVFCRIGNEISVGSLVSKNKIECKSSSFMFDAPKVQVSWNMLNWSNQEFHLDYFGKKHIVSIQEFVIFTLSFIILSFAALKGSQIIKRMEENEFESVFM